MDRKRIFVDADKGKVYYDGIFISRQSLISLLKHLLHDAYEEHVFNYSDNYYQPDLLCLTYNGLVKVLQYILSHYVC